MVSVSRVRNESNFCIVVVVVVEMVMTAIFETIHCQVDRKISHGSNGIVQPIWYKMTFTLVPFAVTSEVDLSNAKCKFVGKYVAFGKYDSTKTFLKFNSTSIWY